MVAYGHDLTDVVGLTSLLAKGDEELVNPVGMSTPTGELMYLKNAMKPIQVDQGLLVLPGYGTPQPVAQISWLEGQGNYTRIHLSGQKAPLLVSRTLKEFEAQLPAFLRATKGALINPAYVVSVTWSN